MPVRVITGNAIGDELVRLDETRLVLFAPIYAPNTEVVLLGTLKRGATQTRWRVVTGINGLNNNGLAVLFDVDSIDRIVHPSAEDPENLLPQIQLRHVTEPRPPYGVAEFT